MAEIQGGVPVTGFVSPTDDADTFATHKDSYGQGGYRSVANIAERDAITTDRRSEGMIVFVNETKVAYQLINGITNDKWQVTNDITMGSLQEDFIIIGNADNEPQASPALLDVEEDIAIIYSRLDELDGGTSGGGTTNGTRNLSGFVVGEVETDGSMYTFRGPDCFLSEIPTGGDVHFFNDRLTGLGDPYAGEIGEQDAVNRRFFDAGVRAVPLDELAVPNADMDFNGKLLNNIATPLSTDTNAAATVEYVDDAIAAGGGGSTTLTGAVTGTGSGTIATTLTPITTSQITNFDTAVRAYRLDQFNAPNTTLSMGGQKISTLSNPTSSDHATNKGYVDNKTWTSSQITDFDTAVRAHTLDQFAGPVSNMDFNGKLLNNVATPLSTNTHAAATVEYVDAAIAAGGGGSTTLTGAVTGTGTGTIATTLTPINTSQITDFNTGTQSLINATPLNDLAWPTGPIQMNGKQLENIGTAIGPTDAVQRQYVDAQVSQIWSTLGTKPYGGLKVVNGTAMETMTSTPIAFSVTQNLFTNVYNFDSPSNGRLRCLSSITYNYAVRAVVQFRNTAVAQATVTMQIVKNGVVSSALPTFTVNATQNLEIALTVNPECISLALNDYIQLYASMSPNGSLILKNMTLIASVIS